MIIGHDRQVRQLTRIARSGFVPHAFLFSGPDHIGKQLVARMFFYLCVQSRSSIKDFFSGDRLVRAIREGQHPDLFVAAVEEGKREISIGQIRALKKFVALSPFELKKKLVLINEAERVSQEGMHSLLKTLEEPSGDTLIALVTSQPSSLPATIRSRSINLSFYPLGTTVLQESLRKAGQRVAEQEFDWIAGRPGLALRFMQDPDDETVQTIRDNFFSFSKTLSKKSIKEKLALAQQTASHEQLLYILGTWLVASRAELLKSPTSAALERTRFIFELRELLTRTNVNTRLQLENTLLRV